MPTRPQHDRWHVGLNPRLIEEVVLGLEIAEYYWGRRCSQRNSGPINVRLKPDDFWAPTVAAENILWHHSDTRIFWIIIRHIVFGSNLYLVKRIGHWVACGIKLWCCTASKCKQSCPKSCGDNVFCLLFWETDWEIRWIKPCLGMNKVRLPKPELFVARTQ